MICPLHEGEYWKYQLRYEDGLYDCVRGHIFTEKELREKYNMITQEQLDNWFMYHSPTPEQTTAYIDIRNAAKHFAEIVLANTPPSADQTTAIRKIREAVMTANASIACGGK